MLYTLAGAGLTGIRLLVIIVDCFIHLSLSAPSRVIGVSLMKTVTSSLNVSWTTPQSEVAITEYQVQYRRNGTTSWNNATTISVSAPTTSTNLTGLDADTEYNVRVRAESDGKAGEWSVEHTERTSSDSRFYVLSLLKGAFAFVVLILLW